MSMVEHVVLFKVKDDVAASEADAIVERIASLGSIEHVLHLTVGPLLHINFTHFFHTRFNSKDHLHAYVAHPSHVAVVKANTPFIHDAIALDWLSDPPTAAVPPPASALRVTFFKLKEDRAKDEVLGLIRGIQQDTIQFTCGENFSPARANGFSIGSLEIFPGLSELEAADSIEKNEKMKEHVESVMVLHYVMPSPS